MAASDPGALTEVVAIDGPAGAGKSSVARAVADRLGYAFLDTGAMYRAAAWWILREDVDTRNAEAIAEAVRRMPLRLEADGSRLRVFVGDEDVSEAIRTPDVTNAIRHLDGLPDVRAYLVEMQRSFASKGPTVAEGRDMGTVVFPAARCKVYLDASIEERTRRRAAQLEEQNIPFDRDALRVEIEARDKNDRTRAVAPLRRADDAVEVDTTGLGFEDVVRRIESLARDSA